MAGTAEQLAKREGFVPFAVKIVGTKPAELGKRGTGFVAGHQMKKYHVMARHTEPYPYMSHPKTGCDVMRRDAIFHPPLPPRKSKGRVLTYRDKQASCTHSGDLEPDR